MQQQKSHPRKGSLGGSTPPYNEAIGYRSEYCRSDPTRLHWALNVTAENEVIPQELDQPIYGLLKFGEKQHIEALRNDGLLYMRPLADFIKLESDMARGDSFEGMTRVIQPAHVKHLILDAPGFGSHAVNPSGLIGPVRVGLGKTAACNIYCMFAITKPRDGDLVSSQNLQFGDFFVIVLNSDEFLDRVINAARDAGLCHFESRLVEYYDPETYSGEVGRFRKRSLFAYQNEFRIAVEPGFEGPIKLFAGSLVDITSEVLPLSEANQYLDFSTK